MSVALSTSGLTIRRGSRTIVKDIALEISRGEIVALMGLSGSGKSTILRAIAGLDPYEGTIAIEGGKAGMVFQFHALFEHLPAITNVMLAPIHVKRAAAPDAEARAHALLTQVGVAHRAHAYPRELSGGEAQRVAIARTLAMDPAVILLDEPTASLDPARRNELGRTLRALAADGRSLLFTSHDDEFVEAFADRVAILADGGIVESGRAADVLKQPSHPATRTLLQIEREGHRA